MKRHWALPIHFGRLRVWSSIVTGVNTELLLACGSRKSLRHKSWQSVRCLRLRSWSDFGEQWRRWRRRQQCDTATSILVFFLCLVSCAHMNTVKNIGMFWCGVVPLAAAFFLILIFFYCGKLDGRNWSCTFVTKMIRMTKMIEKVTYHT